MVSKIMKLLASTIICFQILTVEAKDFHQIGMASWYGYESGSHTASGKIFNPKGLSAAHKTLPLNTKIKVMNLKNKRTLVVPVTDRGPYVKGRILDLSMGAAKLLGITGITKVAIIEIN